MIPKQSEMMEQLYGKDTAAAVFDRCQSLSPRFNELVQTIVYDVFWRQPGLTLREKSLATIVTLIVLGKEEQLKIHLLGFFNLGGTVAYMQEVIQHLLQQNLIQNANKANATLLESSNLFEFPEVTNSVSFNSSYADKALVGLVVYTTLGDNDKTKQFFIRLLNSNALSMTQIEDIMLHIMLYCGFPCAMNGFAVLEKIKDAV